MGRKRGPLLSCAEAKPFAFASGYHDIVSSATLSEICGWAPPPRNWAAVSPQPSVQCSNLTSSLLRFVHAHQTCWWPARYNFPLVHWRHTTIRTLHRRSHASYSLAQGRQITPLHVEVVTRCADLEGVRSGIAFIACVLFGKSFIVQSAQKSHVLCCTPT